MTLDKLYFWLFSAVLTSTCNTPDMPSRAKPAILPWHRKCSLEWLGEALHDEGQITWNE